MQGELVARDDEPPPAHLLDATEQRQLARVAVVGEDGDRPGLRQRLELDHTREHRVAREVARQEGLLAGDPIAGGHGGRGVEGVDGVDEAERRPMREQRDQLVGVLQRHVAGTLPPVLTPAT